MTDSESADDAARAQGATLERAYMATAFVADAPGVRIEIRIGRCHPELDALLAGHGVHAWAFVTAWNPASRLLPDAENAARQRQLRDDLAALCLTSFPGRGVPDRGDWPPEASLLVLGLAEDDARRLGRKHGQNAVVIGKRGEAARLAWCR